MQISKKHWQNIKISSAETEITKVEAALEKAKAALKEHADNDVELKRRPKNLCRLP